MTTGGRGGLGGRRGWVRLLAGPAVLWALWAYAAVAAGADVAEVFRARALGEYVGQPTDAVILALQDERRLSTGGGSAALATQRGRTDEAHARLRRSAGGAWARWGAGDGAGPRVEALLTGLRRLPEIRSTVDAARAENTAAYTDLIDLAFRVYAAPGWDDPRLRDAYSLVALSRARELLAREDVLVREALATGGLSRAQRTALAQLVGAQRLLHSDAEATLAARGDADRNLTRYRAAGPRLTALRDLEDQLVRPDGPPVDARAWADAVEPALAALREIVLTGAREAVRRATPAAVGAIVWAGLVGGLGLVAVIVLSVLALRRPRTPAWSSAPVGDPAAGPDHDDDARRDRELQAVLLDLNRRNQSLLHRQLRVLDGMERRESDEESLSDLFRADHLATRMRRNVEKAVTLVGGTPGRRWRRPVPMVDVIRAAAAEVPDYPRVAASEVEPAALAGPAVADLIHLLAELIENAISFSPADTRVRVGGERDAEGYAVTVTDAGPGMTEDDLATAHEVMADPVPPTGGAWWGLYAVGRFADRHGVTVSLSTVPTGGLAARALVPAELIGDQAGATVPGADAGPSGPDGVDTGPGGTAVAGGRGAGLPVRPRTGPGGRATRAQRFSERGGQPTDRVERLRGRARSAAETIELPVSPVDGAAPRDDPGADDRPRRTDM